MSRTPAAWFLGYVASLGLAISFFTASIPALAQTRWVALTGAPNFRDIGGYSTVDGKHVRWKQVYRSGLLARLTPSDYEKIALLGITVVCDFRSEAERKSAVTNWQGSARPMFFESSVINSTAKAGRDLMEAGGTAEQIKDAWRTNYADAVDRQLPAFKSAMNLVIDAKGPVLYHCSGGKDRTGMYTALLLTFLGVKPAEVVDDYLLTNQVPPPASFIEVAEKVHASNYRRTALGVSDSQLAVLRGRLLE